MLKSRVIYNKEDANFVVIVQTGDNSNVGLYLNEAELSELRKNIEIALRQADAEEK